MSNVLARQLIRMRQETLALKTAHQHGVGAVKTYQYEFDIEGYSESVEFYKITAEVKSGSAAFPMLEISVDDWNHSVRREGYFSSDGMTFTCRFNILTDGLKVVATSTSPLASLTGEWV